MMKSVHMRIDQDLYNSFKEFIKGETITNAITRLIKEEVEYLRSKLTDEDERIIRIVDGKKYDTGTARKVSSRRYNNGLVTVLYKKKNGELFINCYGLGGSSIRQPDIMNKNHDEFEFYLSELYIDESAAEGFEE